MLLLVGGGQLAKSLPLISAVYTAMLLAWSGAVQRLDKLHVVDFSNHRGGAQTGHDASEQSNSLDPLTLGPHGHSENGPLPASAA